MLINLKMAMHDYPPERLAKARGAASRSHPALETAASIAKVRCAATAAATAARRATTRNGAHPAYRHCSQRARRRGRAGQGAQELGAPQCAAVLQASRSLPSCLRSGPCTSATGAPEPSLPDDAAACYLHRLPHGPASHSTTARPCGRGLQRYAMCPWWMVPTCAP